MNEKNCERGSDLIAFLYNETDERETRDFESHLQQCSTCREEVAAFGSVRESITAWRDEALSGFVATTPVRKKSALAALREFFDLSPLWLKAATAFALVTFCVLAALVVFKLKAPEPTLTAATPAAVYTEEDVNRRVKEALAKQEKPKQPGEMPAVVVSSPKTRPRRITEPSQVAKSRRPLSKAEREQLAADLRLLHDADLDLLGDRINQY